jgi:predicted glutamine amidotransferase
MCQLTLTNLHDRYLNSLMIYLLGKNGSEKHDDGCGFITSDNKIWKTELAANKITNLGSIINSNITNNSKIPFHIRSATWGIKVTKENAHPFYGKHFILMHNGTLLPRNGEEIKDKNNDSDSLKFLNSLDECRDINPSGTFEEIFNAAMQNFAGKFAFIIREKETSLDYIVRGRTAELYISKLTMEGIEKGYVINTSKDTMKDSFRELINIWDITHEEVIQFSEPVILEMESIFLANELGVDKIGKAIEVTPKKETNYARGDDYAWRGYQPNTNFLEDVSKGTKEIIDRADKIYEFLHEHSMSLTDFQLMVMISGGVSILELTEEDLEMFIDYMIPKISANKKTKTEVRSILNGGYFPNEVYEKYELEYPWTVNEGEKVIASLKDYYKERK